ncbi:MAG: NADPH:quinone reductase [Pseudomonadota bacterium]
MLAAYYSTRGAAREVLEVGELPTPTPDEGEVLVRIGASGTNPSDVKTRNGNMGPMTVDRCVPHCDGAGVIEAVGEGISDRRVGERVWLYNVNRTDDGLGQSAIGTAAQYVALDADLAVPLTNGVSLVEGACLGVPAMTAHRALFADGGIEGQSILITGGAGAVGAMAIQMATAAGARVITTVSGDTKAEAALADGADAVVNYKTEPLVEAVLEANRGQKLDRVVDVDFGTHINLTTDLLKPNGIVAAYASMGSPQPSLNYYPLMFNNTLMRLVFVYAMPFDAQIEAQLDIDEMLRAGAISPRVASTHPLSDIVAAHEEVEAGQQIGNVVLEIS